MDTEITPEMKLAILKRDEFKCRSCGRQVPKVVLCIDYIDSCDPKKKGTEEELVAICTECHHKHHRMIQPKPLEMMDERKSQMKQFMQWRESWAEFNSDSTEMVVEYINAMIAPYALNRRAIMNIGKALKNYSAGQVIEQADTAFDKTIQFDSDGNNITHDSANDFIANIHKFLFVNSQDEITQKLYYIRGICRNRFHNRNYDCMPLLEEYVAKLKEHGYSERRILDDLKDELIPQVAIGNDTPLEFESHIRQWIKDIQKWIDDSKAQQAKKIAEANAKKRYTNEQIEDIVQTDIRFMGDYVDILAYLLKSYPYYTPEIEHQMRQSVVNVVLDFLKEQKKVKSASGQYPQFTTDESFWDYIDLDKLLVPRRNGKVL